MSYLRSVLAVLLFACCASASAQTNTSFHYAGTLTDTQMAAATGNYDIRVRLYDGAGAGANQLGSDALLPAVPVTLGFFAVDIDFGTAILAPQAWLEFAVQPTGTPGFQTLAPRQQIGHVPFALYSEGADWSGITNVPANVLALTNPVPPAIGTLATVPALVGAPAGGLIVHQIQFTMGRTVTSGNVGPVTAQDVELWLEPSAALPAIVAALDSATTFSMTLNLNFQPTKEIAKFTVGLFESVDFQPAADAGGTSLVHVKFRYKSVLVTSTTTNASFDTTTGVGSGAGSACAAFFSTLGYGAIPPDFTGVTTLAKPSVLGVKSTGLPQYSLPEFSMAITSATSTASAKAIVCALGMGVSNQQVSPAPIWSQYPTAAKDSSGWSLQMSWGAVYFSGFGLNSDDSGNVTLSWEFTPTTTYSISASVQNGTSTVCWNVATHVSC